MQPDCYVLSNTSSKTLHGAVESGVNVVQRVVVTPADLPTCSERGTVVPVAPTRTCLWYVAAYRLSYSGNRNLLLSVSSTSQTRGTDPY